MKKLTISLGVLVLVLVAVVIFQQLRQKPEEAVGASVTVSGLDICFSPKGGCEAKIIEFIKAEKKYREVWMLHKAHSIPPVIQVDAGSPTE